MHQSEAVARLAAWVDRALFRTLLWALELVSETNVPESTSPGQKAENLTTQAQLKIPRGVYGKKIIHIALSIENLYPVEEEDYLGGVVYINGRLHHLCALRVTRNANGEQVATRDPYNRLDDVYSLYDDLDPMEIQGAEGEWLVWMHPGG